MRACWVTVCWLALLSAGCTTTRVVSLPTQDTLVRDQLVIYSDFHLPRHHRLVEELVARRQDVANRLRLPVSDEPIHVYLFESADRYQQFMQSRYPDFPNRRAFFVETDTRLTVFAYWGDRVAEDLRHELTHGYLHTMVPHLPLWVDEGLAEFFEVPRGRNGLNQPHIDLLLAENQHATWHPDMTKLERIESAGTMTQSDYAESWAWMHFMLETTPARRNLLQNHLARLRMAGTASPLSSELRRIEPQANQRLVEHLHQLVLGQN